jgi:hypothetical protein
MEFEYHFLAIEIVNFQKEYQWILTLVDGSRMKNRILQSLSTSTQILVNYKGWRSNFSAEKPANTILIN